MEKFVHNFFHATPSAKAVTKAAQLRGQEVQTPPLHGRMSRSP